ncbi:MAG: hypothetical protein J6J38_07835 [Lachnospiraceae bacterium]|nr:hypothetical protein [Lachnospiraceae bacterium]
MFCIKMRRSDAEFFGSSVAKVLCLIDMWREEQEAIADATRGTQREQKTVERFSDLLRGAG